MQNVMGPAEINIESTIFKPVPPGTVHECSRKKENPMTQVSRVRWVLSFLSEKKLRQRIRNKTPWRLTMTRWIMMSWNIQDDGNTRTLRVSKGLVLFWKWWDDQNEGIGFQNARPFGTEKGSITNHQLNRENKCAWKRKKDDDSAVPTAPAATKDATPQVFFWFWVL